MPSNMLVLRASPTILLEKRTQHISSDMRTPLRAETLNELSRRCSSSLQRYIYRRCTFTNLLRHCVPTSAHRGKIEFDLRCYRLRRGLGFLDYSINPLLRTRQQRVTLEYLRMQELIIFFCIFSVPVYFIRWLFLMTGDSVGMR
uniref:Uncharacterized protein n=1 Tax=Trichogramma kaykai TaxID=54128 RepID=A0ABD2X5B1_9HYME